MQMTYEGQNMGFHADLTELSNPGPTKGTRQRVRVHAGGALSVEEPTTPRWTSARGSAAGSRAIHVAPAARVASAACRMARTCSGVVPQHPPMICTPASRSRATRPAKNPGDSG